MVKEETTKESENEIGGNWKSYRNTERSFSRSGRRVVRLSDGCSEVEYGKDKNGLGI